MGIGSIPHAVLRCLGDKEDLGLHTEMISDSVIDLLQRGVITNRRKTLHPGVSVTSRTQRGVGTPVPSSLSVRECAAARARSAAQRTVQRPRLRHRPRLWQTTSVPRWMSECDSALKDSCERYRFEGSTRAMSPLQARAPRRPRSVQGEAERNQPKTRRSHRAPAGRRQGKLTLCTVSVGAPVSCSRATSYGDANR
jgi:hypothetical protein